MHNPLILSVLEKAVDKLENALSLAADEIVKDATIKRFEYTYEVGFRLLRRALSEFYTQDNKETYINTLKLALNYGLIRDIDIWIQARKGRNYTAHDYSETAADSNYNLASKFLVEIKFLLEELKKLNQTGDV